MLERANSRPSTDMHRAVDLRVGDALALEFADAFRFRRRGVHVRMVRHPRRPEGRRGDGSVCDPGGLIMLADTSRRRVADPRHPGRPPRLSASPRGEHFLRRRPSLHVQEAPRLDINDVERFAPASSNASPRRKPA